MSDRFFEGIVIRAMDELGPIKGLELREPLKLKESVTLHIYVSEDQSIEVGWSADDHELETIATFPDLLPSDSHFLRGGLALEDILRILNKKEGDFWKTAAIVEMTRQAVNTLIEESGKLIVWQENGEVVIFTLVLQELEEVRGLRLL